MKISKIVAPNWIPARLFKGPIVRGGVREENVDRTEGREERDGKGRR